jgi:hypothetical protein
MPGEKPIGHNAEFILLIGERPGKAGTQDVKIQDFTWRR